MKNKFEAAIDNDEISKFFKGEGTYFARGSDWGDHLYVSNWQIMCSTLKKQKPAQSLLTHIFEEYLRYLDDSYNDAESLLRNISSYYTLKNKIPFLSDENYDLIESLDSVSKIIVGRLFRFLREEYDIKNKDLPNNTFPQEIESLIKKGCTIDLEKL
ncbi:hypothetical protein [Pseudomonas cichorii]|uniref:Uncharacterized protein n=1 Tax=Pseudomonas cichorii TaxID=36746 RepID=A0ABQ1DVR6_PSECI|nr:hypothetical protein [Pseudomonas cichorii]QVE17488.1 hypothetical protein KGD89_01565 [Pseudomonas cichorii]GFM95072.1 hypothetical protein PSCICP_50440 [Pseudomonas cichorii]SDP28571.1 hypothetical protein SAMN05216599_1302 [Pseudomonas cichorii]